jgi:hypothetical protein
MISNCGVRILFLVGVFSIFAAAGSAQDAASEPQKQALTVQSGRPLRLIMTERLRFKLNQPVRAKVTEPVYAFDREVIPSGAEVAGRIVGFRRPSRWLRAYSMMSGNFTPLREPQIEFDSLVLRDGTRSMATDVSPGTETMVRFTDSKAPAKGRIATAKDMAREQIEARKRAVIDAVKAPGKMDRLKDALWSMLPYHPQSLPQGTRFTATLKSPLDFGMAALEPPEIDQAGSEPLSTGVVDAVLTTALDSSTAQHGMTVEATVSRPVFSANNHLPASRHWHRSGKLAFMFTSIEAPSSLPGTQSARQVEGRLESVGVDQTAGNVRIDEEGGVTATDSKTRFIAPAVAALLAFRSTEGKDTEPDNDADDATLKPGHIPSSSNHFGPRILAGGAGFGLLGAALGRLSQPVASVLGFYGTARLAYTNIIGRGREITFPQNTPVEIRFDSKDDTKAGR